MSPYDLEKRDGYGQTKVVSRSLTHLFIFGIHYLSVGFIEGSVSICRSYVSRFCRSFISEV